MAIASKYILLERDALHCTAFLALVAAFLLGVSLNELHGRVVLHRGKTSCSPADPAQAAAPAVVAPEPQPEVPPTYAPRPSPYVVRCKVDPAVIRQLCPGAYKAWEAYQTFHPSASVPLDREAMDRSYCGCACDLTCEPGYRLEYGSIDGASATLIDNGDGTSGTCYFRRELQLWPLDTHCHNEGRCNAWCMPSSVANDVVSAQM